MVKATPLPEEFWTQPLQNVEPALQLVYTEVQTRLREENPEADTLELMMIERVAFLYVHIRHKETKRLFDNDRAYKETMQVWTQMAAELRKERVRQETVENAKEAILDAVHTALGASLNSLPEHERKKIMGSLADNMEKIGL